jgi:sorbose reductase
MSIEDAARVRDGFPRPFPDIASNVVQQFRMDGKVVVITGAADGLGLSVAEGIAEAGGHVALWYNSCVSFPLFGQFIPTTDFSNGQK